MEVVASVLLSTPRTFVPYSTSISKCTSPPTKIILAIPPCSSHPSRYNSSSGTIATTVPAYYYYHYTCNLARRRNGSSSTTPFAFIARCHPGRDVGSSSTTNDGDTPSTTPAPLNSDHSTKQHDPPTSQQQPDSGAGAPLPSPPSVSSYYEGLVFDLGPAHSWDSHEVGSPVIKRYSSDDEERWFMWYHGGGGGSDGGVTTTAGDAIGLAISSNGIHWERGSGPVKTGEGVGLVMCRSGDWWAFDTEFIRPSEVLIMSSVKVRAPGAVYWLYYTGFSSEKVDIRSISRAVVENQARDFGDNSSRATASPVLLKSLPGLAISQDGRHWARIEGEHHSGALFDIGAAGEWDSLFVAAPRVVYHGRGDLRMYYHSFDSKCGHYAIGMARSRDGIRWVKLGKVIGGGLVGSFDEAGVTNGHVMRDPNNDGGYLMAFEGVSADVGRRSIGLAQSPDGLKNWRRCGDQAILRPSTEEGWDNIAVGSPCLVPMDGEEGWRLYYRGIGKGGRTGIGLAISEGGEITSFKRWAAGFHL